MGAIYSGVPINGYNANPPDDDGSQTEANRVKWATIKDKITDPTKVRTDSMDTALQASFAKIVGGAGVRATSTSDSIIESDQGKLVRVTQPGVTITGPDATDVDAPFVFALLNNSSGDITFDGHGSQTVDGEASITVPAKRGFFVYTDGANLFTTGQNFPIPVVYPPTGTYKNKSIKVATNTTVTVTVDQVVVTNGTTAKAVAVSSTVNMGTTGVDALIGGTGANGTITINTWYHLYAISKADGTTKVVACTSTTPDAPFLAALANIDSGSYTFYARLGAVRTSAGVAQLMGTWQLGDRAQYKVNLAQTSVIPLIGNGPAGTPSNTSPTYAALSVASFVPSTAKEVHAFVAAQYGVTAFSSVIVAPNGSYSGIQSSNPPPVANFNTNAGGGAGLPFSMLLESSAIYWVSNQAGGAILCTGWEDNL